MSGGFVLEDLAGLKTNLYRADESERSAAWVWFKNTVLVE